MLRGIDFSTAPPARQLPDRCDVACFIGYVARRREVPLPAQVLAQLREAGWVDGPWRRTPAGLASLQQLPVVVDSWDMFDRLFAWERRRVRAGFPGECASYLGAAVRSYFAHGGRRAVIVRVANPWPFLEGDNRAARRQRRLGHVLPAMCPAPRPFAPTDPTTWRGIEHLYGLPEVSHVCFPDLADACALEPLRIPLPQPPAPPPEVFVECSEAEPAPPRDFRLRALDAPRLDLPGFQAWGAAVGGIAAFLRRHRPDALFLGHLPQPLPEARSGDGRAWAEADMAAFLEASGVLVDPAGRPGPAASAFVQLAWPWLRGPRAEDLPRHLEPPDGVLAGLLAGNALLRGTWRSVAGTALAGIGSLEPVPDIGPGGDTPADRLARRVCLVGPDPDGIALLSDVTTSADSAWRQGGVSRIMASLLRAARRIGEAQLFDTHGPATWTRVQRSLEDLLSRYWEDGALGGRTPAEAFSVRCDRSTMSQSDLDNGRVKVEVVVLPAAAIERIRIVLALGETRGQSPSQEVA